MQITKEVVCALADNPDGKSQRAALRKLAEARLKDFEQQNAGQTQGALNQLSVELGATRATIAAVRDALSMNALFALAAGYWTNAAELLGSIAGRYGNELMPDRHANFMSIARANLVVARRDPNAIRAKVDFEATTRSFALTWAPDALDPPSPSASGATASMKPLSTKKLGATMSKTNSVNLPKISQDQQKIIDTILATFGASPYDEIVQAMDANKAEIVALQNGPTGVSIQLANNMPTNIPATGTAPAGNVVMKKANVIFGIAGAGAKVFDFEVITFDYNGASHPAVPEIDPDYVFDPDNLLKALTALMFNKKAWTYGHTGTGKTTLWEQIAARLGWPVIRINFDSEITRLDMIGRDVITSTNGQTVTAFVDGVLPTAMQQPCILLCDEMDFIRPDVAYVMQRALEDKGLLITEDGGRLVVPHPYFRMVATANTKGAGDESGRYMGARPQSGAFLNRFTQWIGVDYMKPEALATLLKSKTGIADDIAKVISNYAKEHWHGFTQNDLMQDLSARNLIACADTYTFYKGLMGSDQALKKAFETAIFDRAATDHDAQSMRGIFQRVTK